MEAKKETGAVRYNYFHWGPFLFHVNVPKEECDIFLQEGARCRKDKTLDFIVITTDCNDTFFIDGLPLDRFDIMCFEEKITIF